MSVNQTTKPITAEIDGEGILKIGGCSTVELVKRYQSPLYVIDEASIRKVCQEYLQAFERYNQLEKEDNEDKKFCPMYACKAQCNMAVAKIIASEGFGFDAVSKGELYTLHKAGIDMNKVLFNGNNKTEDELRLAMMLGVGRYSVDNFLEIENLSKIATEFNQETNILLRITPNIECHTHEYIKTGQIDSKFGFDLNQIDEAIELIKNSGKNIKLRGLHAHIGSQIFEPISYMDEVEILFSELDRIRKKHDIILDEINIGGGLGVKYIESDNPPSIEEIANCILEKMEYCIKKYEMKAPKLYIEPGRSIISQAGVTLYKVGSQKNIPNVRKYISVDGGMADNPRPSMYEAKYEADVANKMNWEKTEKVTIAGKYCESGDILIKDILMPKIETGDIICVYNTGAYNYSMQSNYNSTQKLAMVLVNNSQSDIIVNRETLEDIISKNVLPDRLK